MFGREKEIGGCFYVSIWEKEYSFAVSAGAAGGVHPADGDGLLVDLPVVRTA